MPAESDSVNALVKIFNDMTGVMHRLLELVTSNNTILQGRGYTGRLNDAAQERAAQRTDIQMAFSDRSQLATEIGNLTRRMDRFEDTQREILYRVTPFWIRWRKWWRVTRGD